MQKNTRVDFKGQEIYVGLGVVDQTPVLECAGILGHHYCQDIFSSHFWHPTSLYTKEYILTILNSLAGWVGSAKSRLIDVSIITLTDYVWIAESPNPNVLWHFHRKIVITCITYTIATHYYMHYLSRKSKTRKRRAKRWKLKAKT